MSSISSRNQFQKLFKTEAASMRQQVPSKKLRSNSIYNLKDFLPQTSNISIQSRQKIKSTITSQSSFVNKSAQLSPNAQEKLIQQKMNNLKETNAELMQTVEQQKNLIKSQQQEIINLKKEIQKIELTEKNKLKKLTIWSYKYHVQYSPKQKHKYTVAVQTEDSFNGKIGSSGPAGLRAKDFQDIYRRLNSNPSTIDIGTKKMRKQQINLKLSTNLTLQNPSVIKNNSTLKLTKVFQQNKSLFAFQKQEQPNKENTMQWSNVNFQSNPMNENLNKIQAQQKPVKEQCLQIYPIEEEYLDGIIGEILCGEQV